ncbi:MAG: Bax inhibitor-1 family protein [Planctomycetes bacterium]|nr:Bax inhibitor-1 family protein [Planctomycetota bacterium]
MSFQQTSTAGTFEGAPGQVSVAQESVPARMAFIRKVYALFGGAMIVWMGTAALVASSEELALSVAGWFGGGLGMILFLALAFGILRVTSKSFPLNIVGLAVFALLYGLITGPTVYLYASAYGGYAIVAKAFILAASIFGGLTAYVLVTKKDFSFMGAGLSIALFSALGLILVSMFFGIGSTFVASTGFAWAMVLLFAGYTVYDTSNIVRRYPANMAATAAASIFADFVLMFLYLLRALGGNRD